MDMFGTLFGEHRNKNIDFVNGCKHSSALGIQPYGTDIHQNSQMKNGQPETVLGKRVIPMI